MGVDDAEGEALAFKAVAGAERGGNGVGEFLVYADEFGGEENDGALVVGADGERAGVDRLRDAVVGFVAMAITGEAHGLGGRDVDFRDADGDEGRKRIGREERQGEAQGECERAKEGSEAHGEAEAAGRGVGRV